jgi:asparaginyl-tRNA synthetase
MDNMSLKEKVYVCQVSGSDESGDGTKSKPFASLLKAIQTFPEGAAEVRKAAGEEFQEVTKTALKKVKGQIEILERKAKKNAEKVEEQTIEEQERLEEAKKVVIEENENLPKAKTIKIRDSIQAREANQRVLIHGWVHRLRTQGKNLTFIVLRDGTGYLQCLLQDKLCQTFDALTLTVESTVSLYGTLVSVPEGKTAPGGHELKVDYWKVIHKAPGGDDAFESQMNTESDPDVLLNMRHLVLRGETTAKILKMRSFVMHCFREHYMENGYFELTPPCLVQTACEGGSTLFHLDYHGEKAYLTQSSQLYLETACPALGDVFCIQESFRAEKSHTRRHLSEYTHIESECAFIDFEGLLDRLEFLVCDVVDKVLKSPEYSTMLYELNPEFVPLKRPFKRMQYTDALKYLKSHDICKPDGTFYEFGDDIPEAPERAMTDAIGEPIFLCNFPAEIKAFYMQKCAGDRRITESSDLLIPGVGEIVGASMRMWDYNELMAAYRREGIDPTKYYWYTDLRKYGSFPHGGYGLGLERFLAWLLKRHTVRDVCFYPRFSGRCTP